jgi:hypothetical protein
VSDAKFEKVSYSNKPMYGSRKLLLCGFAAAAQPKFETVLEYAGLAKLGVIWAATDQSEMRVGDLMALPSDSGRGQSSALPRAIIVSGLTENELHRLMTVCRKTGMKQSLWAALTPTSETWPLKDLLAELSAERKAMQKRR